MEEERWRVIPGFPLYEVSDLGRVRHVAGEIMRGFFRGKGYQGVALKTVEGGSAKWHWTCVHNLVLLAFVGPPPKGLTARHFPNANKWDNRLSNLSYGTYWRQHLDQAIQLPDACGTAKRVGLKVKLEACARVKNGESIRQVAKSLGLHHKAVWYHINRDQSVAAYLKGEINDD